MLILKAWVYIKKHLISSLIPPLNGIEHKVVNTDELSQRIPHL